MGAQDYLLEKYRNIVSMKANRFFLIGAESDDMIQEGKITDGIHVSPLYLKKSQAERELEEKEKGESN